MPRVRRTASATSDLRSILTGAAIRAIAGIRDFGEAILGKIENQADPNTVSNTDGGADVWMHYTDVLGGGPGLGRLFVPGNILFALPIAGDSCMVLRGRDAHAPGTPYILHGDLGDASRVPPWMSTPKDGLYTPRVLRLESSAADVEVVPPSGHKVYVGAGAGGGTQPAMLGNDVNAYLGTLRDKINALEDLLGDFITKYNGHGHVVSGTATGTPMPPEPGTPPAHVTDPPALAANVEVK